MTPREIIIANIEFSCDERIGFNFSQEGRLNDFVGTGVSYPFEPQRWEDEKFDYYTDVWGNTWFRVKGLSQGGEIYKPAISEWDDLDKLKLPDYDNPSYYENARKLVIEDKEHYKVGWMPGWPFATCRYMRKMEIYFVDLITERERINILHDRVTAVLEKIIENYGKVGMDAIMFCEDLGVQDRLLMSPAMWRDIFRPLYERLTSCAHKYGMKVIQHSCGYNWLLIDDLCHAGIDCLQFDQPAVYDMPALAKKLRHYKVGLFSPCDIQKVLPTGNREFIESETRRLVNTFRGGFIAKNYPDLHGIGVDPQWDKWAYDIFVEEGMRSSAGRG